MKSITHKNKLIAPSKIVCIGRNYVDHNKELGNVVPIEPVIFMKPNSAISNSICFDDTDSVHYEGEISFVVKSGKLTAVGFGLDLTKREIQNMLKAKGLPWERAKAFDGSAVFSEFVDFEKVEDLRLELFINKQLVQQGGCDLMLYQPLDILADIQSFCTLNDGDVIMTGTPKGVGKIILGDEFIGKIFSNEKLLLQKQWIVK